MKTDIKKQEFETLLEITLHDTYGLLEDEYNQFNSNNNKSMSGFCDIASKKFNDNLHYHLNLIYPDHKYELKTSIVHGELGPSMKLLSKYWSYEHTISKVEYGDIVYFVDLTCGQFIDIVYGIPSYYISYKKPKWILLDSDNPILKYERIKRLNKKYKIRLRLIDSEIGVINYFIYFIGAIISDIGYNIIFKHKMEKKK